MPVDSKFEFKVVTDKEGKAVQLEDMSVDAAKAFLTFYQTLVSLAELSGEGLDPRIGIKPGSAVASVIGATAERINNDFASVSTAQCSDPEIVKLWRDVQTQIQANGLSYEINHITSKGVEALHNEIKASKTFVKKPIKSQYANSIKFFSGRLINVGGKYPNIHIEVDGKKITIDCKEQTALDAKDYLYKPIRVAVWAKVAGQGSNNAYELADVYPNDDEYNAFKTYFEELGAGDKIASLTNIHRRIKALLTEGDFHTLRRLLQLWLHPTTDIQTLKIILVITKSFSQDRRLSGYIELFQGYFNLQNTKLLNKSKRNKAS